VGQLRLRFRVSAPGYEPLNVRFDPLAMEFRWSPGGWFNWNELMVEPKQCIARLRKSQVSAKTTIGSEEPLMSGLTTEDLEELLR